MHDSVRFIIKAWFTLSVFSSRSPCGQLTVWENILRCYLKCIAPYRTVIWLPALV